MTEFSFYILLLLFQLWALRFTLRVMVLGLCSTCEICDLLGWDKVGLISKLKPFYVWVHTNCKPQTTWYGLLFSNELFLYPKEEREARRELRLAKSQ